MSYKLTSDWVKFDGEYIKKMHDVKLFDGTVIEKCWPNAGVFMVCDKNDAPEIQLKDVEFVRKSKQFYSEE